MDEQAIEIACDIHAAKGFGPVDLEWSDLTPFYSLATHIPGGARAELPVRFKPALDQLIKREQGCCQFLTFDLQQSTDHVTLTVTTKSSDAIPVIESLLGLDTADV